MAEENVKAEIDSGLRSAIEQLVAMLEALQAAGVPVDPSALDMGKGAVAAGDIGMAISAFSLLEASRGSAETQKSTMEGQQVADAAQQQAQLEQDAQQQTADAAGSDDAGAAGGDAGGAGGEQTEAKSKVETEQATNEVQVTAQQAEQLREAYERVEQSMDKIEQQLEEMGITGGERRSIKETIENVLKEVGAIEEVSKGKDKDATKELAAQAAENVDKNDRVPTEVNNPEAEPAEAEVDLARARS